MGGARCGTMSSRRQSVSPVAWARGRGHAVVDRLLAHQLAQELVARLRQRSDARRSQGGARSARLSHERSNRRTRPLCGRKGVRGKVGALPRANGERGAPRAADAEFDRLVEPLDQQRVDRHEPLVGPVVVLDRVLGIERERSALAEAERHRWVKVELARERHVRLGGVDAEEVAREGASVIGCSGGAPATWGGGDLTLRSRAGPSFSRNSRDIAAKPDAVKLTVTSEEGFAMHLASTFGDPREQSGLLRLLRDLR